MMQFKVYTLVVLFILIGYTTCLQRNFFNVETENSMKKVLHDFSGITKVLFKNEYEKYRSTGESSETLKMLYDFMKLQFKTRHDTVEELPIEMQLAACATCRSTIGILLELRQIVGVDDYEWNRIAKEFCIELEIQAPIVCDGWVDLNTPIFLHIIDNRPNLTEDFVCGVIMQGSNCIITDEEQLEWSIDVDPNGNPIIDHKFDANVREDNDIQIVHITDIHFDPNYAIGSNANCEELVCCRTGIPSNPEDAAQKWGDYRQCDSPWDTVPDLTEQIVREHSKIDYIYYTGDILDHGIWETSIEGNIASIQRVFRQFVKDFGNIPVFPILGNHDSHPTDVFPPSHVPEELSVQWLYDLIAEEWSQWLRDEGVNVTLRQGGFYTVLLRPGFRVVGLNNQDCYNHNFWILYEPQFGSIQLQWLHDTLLEAEKNNEKVHILAHIPSGDSACIRIWAREYRRIIDRFWNTITGIFNGHTHKDEFNVIYSRNEPSFAINVGFIGGSATTFSNLNHNYRMYYVNENNFQVTDYDNYIFNLTEANLTPNERPRWFKNYSFKNEYNVSDMSPASLHRLVEDFASKPDKLKTYWQNKYKSGDAALSIGCDDECLANHLCAIVTNEYNDNRRCLELIDIFTKSM